MAQRKTLTVSITSEQDAFVREYMACGRYASATEVVRAALRSLQQDVDRELRRGPSAPDRLAVSHSGRT